MRNRLRSILRGGSAGLAAMLTAFGLILGGGEMASAAVVDIQHPNGVCVYRGENSSVSPDATTRKTVGSCTGWSGVRAWAYSGASTNWVNSSGTAIASLGNSAPVVYYSLHRRCVDCGAVRIYA